MLSVKYPVATYQLAWEMIPSFLSKKRDHKHRDRSITTIKSQRLSRKLTFDSETSCSYGLLHTALDLISSTWMTFDTQAHQEALKVNRRVF